MTAKELELIKCMQSACVTALATAAGMIPQMSDEYFNAIAQLNGKLDEVKKEMEARNEEAKA